ncbi:MAG TPA: hypothetical protein VKH42_17645, partial [Vicinamibacterales bacterium]|nr:hypothetical protein [Vicinamibacterales bacterium]
MRTTIIRQVSVAAVVFACDAISLRAQSLPAGWSARDIGAVGTVGVSSGSGASFAVTGDGADIWGSADAFQFAFRTLTGDGFIVARVATVEPVADWTKAGVMMRETLSAGSRHAFMLVSAAKGLAFQRRVSTNGSSTSTSGGAGAAPAYVKLARSGNTFTAYRSADGAAWTLVGSEVISMASTIEVGLAVSSHVAGNAATAQFDHVTAGSTVVSTTTGETLVFFRHGEKPSGGYGQLTCQGLNRALALHSTLTRQFGTPQFMFAPNPLPAIGDPAGSFDYVRPLATIEPTAIRLGLPVNAQYGYSDVTGLQTELLSTTYASATVFINWEHQKLQQLVQNLMNLYGGGAAVPAWSSTDYDSVYVVRLTRTGGAISAQFEHDFEG